jgi:hypothetical protein
VRLTTAPCTSTAVGVNEKRSIVAQFRRRGFLDFLYFTDYETSDPAWYAKDTFGLPTNPDLVGWAATSCAKWWRQGRGNERYYDPNNDGNQDGKIFYNGQWQNYWSLLPCSSIQFADGDHIRGPFHTNDDILVCGDPNFGRGPQDSIEVSAPPDPSTGYDGYRKNCGSGSYPELINGAPWKPNSPIIAMPPSNTKLKQVVQSAYLFTGKTTITLSGGTMLVTNVAKGLSNSSMSLPSNGVIYVENGNCGQGYDPNNPYPTGEGCADVHLSGNYSQDLTIATEKDIIVRGNIVRSGGSSPVDKVLGLIANQFVRIYHPVGSGCGSNLSGTMTNVTIEAAILALQHSFTVDNYYCGAPLQDLTVFGAIAQKFRGPVGTGGSSGVTHGYLKDYNYDDRLRLRQPPHFLDPVQSAWRVMRQWEQVPAY